MTKRIKLRTLLTGGLITLLFLGIIVRVYWVQVVKADFWTEQAMKTWITSETLPQERGKLLDRDGKVLAADALAYTVAVGPKRIAELEKDHPEWRLTDQIVSKLHAVLGTSEDDLRKMIASKKDNGELRAQREIRPDGWKIDKSVMDRLAAFRTEMRKLTGVDNIGLYFMNEQKRYYPNDSLASHILGYEDKEGNAIAGLEKKLNDQLSGTPGFMKYQKDGERTQLPNGQLEYKQPVDGKTVTLTIDLDIQYYIEEALRAAFEKYKPISITAIAADPSTMEILGMASLPDYNPNLYWEKAKDQAAFRDNSIQSLYEPGSTFKIVTLAAAVQEGLFKPDDKYKSGSISFKNVPTIRDHNGSGWGEISYLDGLKHSSNVAFVKLGYEMLGKEKLVKYINNFGFGQKTGIELPNEGSRSVNLQWPSDVARATFGQGSVLVTPIQQVTAVAAVANGGKLMVPHIVKSISDPATGEKQVTEPQVVRQVISDAASRQVGEYLETVVSDKEIGTGKSAFIPGYRIAGKTGTAQKVVKNEETGKSEYSKDRYVVSFIGYAPVENPKVVLYIVVDEPQVDNAGGGAIAGPIFKDIMGKSLKHLGIKPNLPKEEEAGKASGTPENTGNTDDVTAIVPDVTGMTVAQAKDRLKQGKFPVGVHGSGSKVLQQLPKAGSVLPSTQRIYLLTDTKPGNVPELKGLSLRDAMEMCMLLKVAFTVEGEGYVVGQKAVKNAEGKWILQIKLAPANEPAASPSEPPDLGASEGASPEG
ncbi:penicillin-binding transpeptidase domain-containing protein [Cohnella suwonensis]|uniref:Penicillin-binding transpeptidase domain-containing protein n=1 Tax=Cohnella suwonensis TaxID=696072 RepID=A0ABW0LMN0_9BACL